MPRPQSQLGPPKVAAGYEFRRGTDHKHTSASTANRAVRGETWDEIRLRWAQCMSRLQLGPMGPKCTMGGRQVEWALRNSG